MQLERGQEVRGYEAQTLKSEHRVRGEHVSDTDYLQDTCLTRIKHSKSASDIKNHKLMCRHHVQCRVGFDKIQRLYMLDTSA